MRINLPCIRNWLSSVAIFFVVPQVLAELVCNGTMLQDILVHLSGDPIFGLGLLLGKHPPALWWLDAICAFIWFAATSSFLRFCEHFFRKRNMYKRYVTIQVGFVIGVVALAIIPNKTIPGTIQSVVLQNLTPGMTFSESRSLVPRQWRSGMYYGMKIDDLVINQDERLSGYFYPEKDWSKAKKEFSITHELPDGSEEHAYLYFDENGKLLFWKYCPR